MTHLIIRWAARAVRKFTGEIEFAFLVVPGLLFLLSWYLDGRRRESTRHVSSDLKICCKLVTWKSR